jgi:F1F0 ATPase subunit 2
MNEAFYLILSCSAGMLLGALFFGGLLWTVRRCLTTPYPALWLLGSALVRMSITLAGFYLVSAGQWTRMLACLVGFITARVVVMRTSNNIPQAVVSSQQGSKHASQS